jgi:hypothetical protein
MTSPQVARPSRAGFTVVEVVLGGLFLASLLLVAGLATDRCLALFRQRRATEELSTKTHRLLQQVVSELAFARASTLAPGTLATQGASSIRFQRSLGVEAGVPTWGPFTVLRWERDPGETDDGLDENGNGLVDEGQLVWIEDEGLPGERRVVLGRGLCELLPGESFDGTDEDGDGRVDERGLCFTFAADTLTIQLGLQSAAPSGTLLTKVVEAAVYPRN